VHGEKEGPSIISLASKLTFVKRPEVWATYFRNHPIEISERDFDVLAKAIEAWRNTRRSISRTVPADRGSVPSS
jgi:hypothetical protein